MTVDVSRSFSFAVVGQFSITSEWCHHIFSVMFRSAFALQECMQRLRSHRFTVSAVQAQELDDIFDSMDFDGNGELSVGEWAGGMAVFFKGNIQEKVRSVVNLKFGAGCFNRGIFFFS